MEELKKDIVSKNMADEENSFFSFVINSGWLIALNTFATQIPFINLLADSVEAKKTRYVSLYKDTIYIFKTKGKHKYNGIDDDEIIKLNIKDIKSFLINRKNTPPTEKEIKKRSLIVSIKYSNEQIVGTIIPNDESINFISNLMAKINELNNQENN